MSEEPKTSKYQQNKKSFLKYQKKRYDEDEDFREKTVERATTYAKNRYLVDEEYRQKRLEAVKAFRARKKEQKLKEQQVLKELEELKPFVEKYNMLQASLIKV